MSTTAPTRDRDRADPELEGFLALLAARRAPRTVDAYRRDLAHLPDGSARPSPRRDRRPRARISPSCAPTASRPRRSRGGVSATRCVLRPPGAARRAHRQPRRRAGDAPAPPRSCRGRCRRARPSALIEAANGTTPRALRDPALVELLYGAGLRVSEAVGPRAGRRRPRRAARPRASARAARSAIVPIGREAAEALRRYLARGRPYLDRRHRPELFLNAKGGPLTRAGAFLILRRLADEGRPRARAASTPTCCATRSRPTCSRAAPTCARVQEMLGHADLGDDRDLHARLRPPPARGVLRRAPARAPRAKPRPNGLSGPAFFFSVCATFGAVSRRSRSCSSSSAERPEQHDRVAVSRSRSSEQHDREPAHRLVVVARCELVQQRPHRVDVARMVAREQLEREQRRAAAGRALVVEAAARAARSSGGSGTVRSRGRRPRARGSRRCAQRPRAPPPTRARRSASSRSSPASAKASAWAAASASVRTPSRSASAEPGRRSARWAGSGGRCASARGCAPTSRRRASRRTSRAHRRRDLGDVEHDRRPELDVGLEHAVRLSARAAPRAPPPRAPRRPRPASEPSSFAVRLSIRARGSSAR